MIGLALFALIIPFMLISMLISQNTGPQGMPSQVEGIHPVLLNAYGQAADRATEIESDCQGMRWSILAGIGQKESNHAQGSSISADGDTDPRIIGPRLDGSGAGGNTTAFPDTDLGVWDGDDEFDRAVGPMQFIPSSWVIYGQDGNGDGEKDPHNVFDATLAAVAHLCGNGPWDFTKRDDLRQALWNYNNSNSYVDSVLSNIDNYDSMTVVFMGDGNISHHASNVPATGATYQCAPHGGATQLTCLGYQAVMDNFSHVNWGAHCTRSSADDHGAGRACDFMTNHRADKGNSSENANGDTLALWMITNHEQLGIDYVIWRQSIWNPTWTECPAYRTDRTDNWYNSVPDMPGGKWCGMEDRGDDTQNHNDHVHVSFTH